MKLSRPANISPSSRIRKICLPFINIKPTTTTSTTIERDTTEVVIDDDVVVDDDRQSQIDNQNNNNDDWSNDLLLGSSNDNNYLRNMRNNRRLNIKEILIESFKKNLRKIKQNRKIVSNRRRNDKFLQEKNGFNRKSDHLNLNNPNINDDLLLVGRDKGQSSALLNSHTYKVSSFLKIN